MNLENDLIKFDQRDIRKYSKNNLNKSLMEKLKTCKIVFKILSVFWKSICLIIYSKNLVLSNRIFLISLLTSSLDCRIFIFHLTLPAQGRLRRKTKISRKLPTALAIFLLFPLHNQPFMWSFYIPHASL